MNANRGQLALLSKVLKQDLDVLIESQKNMPIKGDQEFVRAFGEHLRTLRKSKGMTQEDIMEKSGLNLRQVGRMERGERNSSISTVKLFADALGVHIKELFDFEIPD